MTKKQTRTISNIWLRRLGECFCYAVQLAQFSTAASAAHFSPWIPRSVTCITFVLYFRTAVTQVNSHFLI